MTNFATAYGLMQEAPEAFDISSESEDTLKLYGVDADDRKSFGWQCLTTRRLIERGVRVVELFDVGSSGNWDARGDLVGGGAKRGCSYGSTDDIGATVAENEMDVHDFHATILHLLGLDHEDLTYHFSGRDYRLTDVAGNAAYEIVT